MIRIGCALALAFCLLVAEQSDKPFDMTTTPQENANLVADGIDPQVVAKGLTVEQQSLEDIAATLNAYNAAHPLVATDTINEAAYSIPQLGQIGSYFGVSNMMNSIYSGEMMMNGGMMGGGMNGIYEDESFLGALSDTSSSPMLQGMELGMNYGE
ncbi:hypothetical protein [Helicobacter suis]|uniref:hypothetical protein n=1 Tax=Helicobacter suis TaxID=104628 RepID=UPI000CF0DAFC|nr:hypothetical protein [Helicobacter suis]